MILCLLFGDKLVGDWEVGVFLVEACVSEKYLIAGSIFNHREVAERVGDNVGFAGKISDFRPMLFNNQPPAGDTVGCEVGKGKIFVVSVNNNLLARKDGSVLAKHLDERGKFELGNGVPGLAIGQLARVEGNWLVFLSDDMSDLIF